MYPNAALASLALLLPVMLVSACRRESPPSGNVSAEDISPAEKLPPAKGPTERIDPAGDSGRTEGPAAVPKQAADIPADGAEDIAAPAAAPSPPAGTPAENAPAPAPEPAVSTSTSLPPAPPAFAQCKACHSVDANGKSGVGPNLHAVFGAKAGSQAGFAYSPAMKMSGITWNEATLDGFIEAPQTVVKGNRMPFAGEKNRERRAAIIAFLKAQD